MKNVLAWIYASLCSDERFICTKSFLIKRSLCKAFLYPRRLGGLDGGVVGSVRSIDVIRLVIKYYCWEKKILINDDI